LNLGDIGTAMVTPFNEQGEIDEGLTKALVNHLVDHGTDTIVVNGTTGESPTVTREEKRQMLAWVLEEAAGRVKVIAGTGTNNTYESIELTKEAEEVGVDGVMLVTPYYNKPNQEALYAHFGAIAKETTLPILLYNIPGRSVINMTAETTIRLAKDFANIQGVKEASGDLEQMAAIIHGTDESFAVYSGDDGLTLPLLAIGGTGIISVSSHVVGLEMKQMIQAYKNGEVALASKMHLALLPLFQALFKEPNPVPLKYALNQQGIKVGDVRLPLVELQDKKSFDEAWKTWEREKKTIF